MDSQTRRSGLRPVLRVEALSKTFASKTAFCGVSFRLQTAGALGIVGESGSGKSTLARCVARLEEPTSGKIIFCDENFTALTGKRLRQIRQKMQMVFQEAKVAFNPKMTIGQSFSEAIGVIQKYGGNTLPAEKLLELVDLPATLLSRYPAELSGGQLQRVAIARALAVQPLVLIADEPTSPLDSLSRHALIELLQQLRHAQRLALIFISHDIRAVAALCEEILILHQGRQIEYGPAHEIFQQPGHPWTKRLIEKINFRRQNHLGQNY
jgi:ABC-type glutathione transport system ATPase component